MADRPVKSEPAPVVSVETDMENKHLSKKEVVAKWNKQKERAAFLKAKSAEFDSEDKPKFKK